MQLLKISYGLLVCLAAHVSATALTYKLGANEKACFFTQTQNKGEKIAFYFAVCARPRCLSGFCRFSDSQLRARCNPEARSTSTTK
jgi:hypothetical protein